MFSPSVYSERRNQLRQLVGNGVILLLGNSECPYNYPDNTYAFRQDSTFLYYCGLIHPDLVLLLDTETGADTLFGDDYTIDMIVWMGVQPRIAERASWAGIGRTEPMGALAGQLDKIRQQGKQIHFLPPYRGENKIQLFELLGVPLREGRQKASVDLIRAVVQQRSHKSEEEIGEIERAVDITVDMHLAAMRMVRPGMLESEVNAEVTRIALESGGYLSFPVIATINGQTLHNHYHGNRAESGRLFLLDCGAETPMGYAGDLSSTFPVDKAFTQRQKEVFAISSQAHQRAVSMLQPGIRNKEVHFAACRVIAEGMKQMGLMKGNTEDALQQGAHAMFIPCGTGHMLGLDVHDMENLGENYVGYDPGEPHSTQFGLKSLRLARALEPGFVLTVEPGIYFIPDLIDLWRAEGRFTDFLNYDQLEKFKDFGGIRNEENYLITANGARRLGKKKPMTIAEVEAERTR